MATGTPLTIGFWMASQSHIDERYFNNGVPWASTAEVLSGIPTISRVAYLTVNVAGTEYWFLPDLTTLANKIGTIVLVDGAVTLTKMANVASGSVFYRKTAGAGPPEVQTLAQFKTDLGLTGTNSGDQDLSGKVDKVTGSRLINSTEAAVLALLSGTNTGDETTATILSKLGVVTLSGSNTGDQDLSGKVDKVTGKGLSTEDYSTAEKTKLAALNIPVRITLPAVSGVAAKCAGAVEGSDYPTGWTIAASSTYNLLITHTLTGKKIATVAVYEIDTPGERMLVPFSSAFTGVLGNATTVLIEGLAPISLALRIELTFN